MCGGDGHNVMCVKSKSGNQRKDAGTKLFSKPKDVLILRLSS